MSPDQFCQNCGQNLLRLSAEEEERYARDPGYCPNCGYQLIGNYPLPSPPPPPAWDAPNSTMPTTKPTRSRNLFIVIGSFLLIIVGLLVLLASCDIIAPGLIGQKPTPTATTNGGSSANQGSASSIAGSTQAMITQTAQAGGGGTAATATPSNGAGGGNGNGNPATPGSGGGGNPTATPVATGGGGGGGQPTATPAPPVVVTISAMSISVQCGDTTTIIMTNPSTTQAANWTAHAVSLPAYTLTPSSGTIAPGGSQTMVVSNISKLLPLGTIIITSGGVPQTVTITCSVL